MYQYTPLAEPDAIRLLLLEPRRPGDPIHCSLFHTTSRECRDDIYESYTALSYVWGDAREKRTIFVNSLPFDVTVNLAAALDDIRDEKRPLRLWADAICINQKDIPERNSQISIMRDIYEVAQQTIVYLGQGNERFQISFKICAAYQYNNVNRNEKEFGKWQSRSSYRDPGLLESGFTRSWS